MPTISVIIDLDPGAGGLPDLVRSLDTQSADSSDFDVVFAGIDATSDVGRRLAVLADHRPNVQVSTAAVADAVAAARGSWVLLLPSRLCASGIRLHPEAVARLTAAGETHRSDAVLGRVDFAGGSPVCDLFIQDTARLHAPPVGVPDPALVLYRREYAVAHGIAESAGEIADMPADAVVSVVGSYPAAQMPDGAKASTDPPNVESVSAEWQDGAAVITVSGRAVAADANRAAVLSVRHQRSGLEFWLDADSEVDADGAFSATARLDPRTAALGTALAPGPWTVRIGVHGSTDAWSTHVPAPAVQLGPAILDGLLVGVDRAGSSLALDIGATRASVIGRLAPADVEIAETWRGTLLTAAVPSVTVTGASQTRGHLLLGKFVLPAELEAADGTARLTCYLSGLAGTSSLSTRFGGPAAATGLDLVIDGVGAMSVVPTPPPAPKVAAKRVPQRAPKQAPVPRSATVSRLRHAVPGPLEPAVRKLAHNRTARRVYRRLGGLHDR
ncbi:MAG TPA: hypothetical protein VH496_09270 [Mycobacterium sp.]